MTNKKYILVVGPTASGKSSLGLSLAKSLSGEIVCCDSVQFYKGFDIGSAKPSLEEQSVVPHHLFSVANAGSNYTAGDFRRDGRKILDEIISRGNVPIVVGGTGLYMRALTGLNWHELPPSDPKIQQRLDPWQNSRLRRLLLRLDPKRGAELHENDRVRHLRALELRMLTGKSFSELTKSQEHYDDRAFTVIMSPERSALRLRIKVRTDEMLAAGLIEEVQSLLDAGVGPHIKAMQSIGYKQVVEYLEGNASRDQLAESIVIATRQYAKRQDTWFRSVSADMRVASVPPQVELTSQIIEKFAQS